MLPKVCNELEYVPAGTVEVTPVSPEPSPDIDNAVIIPLALILLPVMGAFTSNSFMLEKITLLGSNLSCVEPSDVKSILPVPLPNVISVSESPIAFICVRFTPPPNVWLFPLALILPEDVMLPKVCNELEYVPAGVAAIIPVSPEPSPDIDIAEILPAANIPLELKVPLELILPEAVTWVVFTFVKVPNTPSFAVIVPLALMLAEAVILPVEVIITLDCSVLSVPNTPLFAVIVPLALIWLDAVTWPVSLNWVLLFNPTAK